MYLNVLKIMILQCLSLLYSRISVSARTSAFQRCVEIEKEEKGEEENNVGGRGVRVRENIL